MQFFSARRQSVIMLSMQTPIDFGKDFLNKLFDERDADACLKMLAGDLVWITPEDMHHFLTKGEVLSFLKKKAAEEAGTRFVDISSIRSSPSADEIMTVAYEVNLVSKEDEKARPLYLRCSMVICRRDGRLEISFLHFSEKADGRGAQQLHDFVTNLPCGVMILACLDGQGEEAVFYNDYFARRLRYKQEVFAKKVRRNPFFMASEEDREKIREEIGKARKNGGNISVNLRFYRRDGNSFYYKMTGAPAWEAEYGAMYYCVFQETTGYRLAADRLEAQLETAAGILRQVPEGLCVIEYAGGEFPAAKKKDAVSHGKDSAGDPGENTSREKKAGTTAQSDRILSAGEEARASRVIYTSKNIPSMFGVSVSAYTRNILSDPFYGLEITSITREKLMSSSILNKEKAAVGKPVSCGIFRVRRPEEKTGEKQGGKQGAKAPRVELVIRRTQEKNGNGRLYLFYYDREAQQRETEERIDRAMRMGRAGQETLRDQLEKAKEKAAREQSELSNALRKEKKRKEEAVSKLEELLSREKGNSALVTASLDRSREDLRKMALELERVKEDASKALKNMLRQVQEDAERERQTLLRKAEEETERRVREARRKAEEDAEIRIREAQQKAQEDAERRIREARLRAQEDAEGRIQKARQKAEEDAEGRIQEARQKAEEDAEGRIQEARQKAEEDSSPLRKEQAVGHDTITFSPEECISAVLDLKREECAEKDVSLELHFDSGMPASVTGFGNLLAGALRELVENAVFRARRGGRISVHCRSDRPSKGLITLSFRVDDDGVPISEAGMRTLFRAQPFLYQEADYMDEMQDSPDLAAMTHSFVPGGEYWPEDAEEAEMEISEAPASDALPSGLFAAREAAALMGGSLHARSSERDTRFLLNVVLHIQTDVFEREP